MVTAMMVESPYRDMSTASIKSWRSQWHGERSCARLARHVVDPDYAIDAPAIAQVRPGMEACEKLTRDVTGGGDVRVASPCRCSGPSPESNDALGKI